MGRIHRKKSGFLSYLNKQKDLAKLIPTSLIASPWLVPRFPWPPQTTGGQMLSIQPPSHFTHRHSLPGSFWHIDGFSSSREKPQPPSSFKNVLHGCVLHL